MLVKFRARANGVGDERSDEEDDRYDEAEEGSIYGCSAKSQHHNVGATGKDPTDGLATEHSPHVLRRKTSSNAEYTTLKEENQNFVPSLR